MSGQPELKIQTCIFDFLVLIVDQNSKTNHFVLMWRPSEETGNSFSFV